MNKSWIQGVNFLFWSYDCSVFYSSQQLWTSNKRVFTILCFAKTVETAKYRWQTDKIIEGMTRQQW